MTIEAESELYHNFAHPVRSVAVVGSGASGGPAARHLRDAGLRVTVFERQAEAGGIWNWSPEVAPPLSVPTPPPSRGAFLPRVPDLLPHAATRNVDDKIERLRFSPPNPVYWSLSNNVPTSTMVFKDFSYPPGTAQNIRHDKLAEYIRSYVRHFGVDKITSYNTRVEKAIKVEVEDVPKWRLTLRKAEHSENEAGLKESFWVEDFDALVVATGHYNAPFIPDIPGAEAWAERWPQQVLHSNGYRVPEPFKDQTILIVGIGTSGIDIARDLAPHARKVYMVGREHIKGPDGYRTMRKTQRLIVPPNAEIVTEIRRFLPPSGPGASIEQGRVQLSDGRLLSDISLVLFATGYQYSYPFLPQYHRDPILGPPSETEKSRLLVTDGGGVLNLYRDVFYVPDPTLAFLGLSVNTSAFSFFEYQSLAVARVFGGTARLPARDGRERAYAALVATKGEGKFSHFMGKENERTYVRETVEWLNTDAALSGAPKIEGHSPEWLAASDQIHPNLWRRYGLNPEVVMAQIQREIQRDKEQEEREERSGGKGDVKNVDGDTLPLLLGVAPAVLVT